jgi:hypothetical protein
MKRFIAPLLVVVTVSFLAGSCILDPKKVPPDKKTTGGTYKSLKSKDDVLLNLELSYNERNLTQYDKLLDDNFTFFFSDADFSSGKVNYQQWDRALEIQSTRHLFDRNYSGSQDPIRSISLKLLYSPGDIGWEETTPDSSYQGEKWYQKTVNYDLTVQTTANHQFLAQDLQALFVIRYAFVPSLNDTIWRIVQWYDIPQ